MSVFTKSLGAAGVVCALTAAAHGQVNGYTFTVDSSRSTFRVTGNALGLPLSGDRTAAIGGTIRTRIKTTGSTINGFIIDGSVIDQLDPLRPQIDNPIPFLPPLEEFEILNVSTQVTTGPTRTAANGSFNVTDGAILFLDGTFEATGIVDIPLTPLAGEGQSPVLFAGTLTAVGSVYELRLPLNFVFDNGTVHIEVQGDVVATATR